MTVFSHGGIFKGQPALTASAAGRYRHLLPVLVLILLPGCARFVPSPGIGDPVGWSELPGWSQDSQSEAWPALLAGCRKLSARDPDWRQPCAAAAVIEAPDDEQARVFFEQWFVAHEVIGLEGGQEGLITGYYEPRLYGSPQPDDRFRYPLYRRPDDLLTVDLQALFPELKGKRVRGRLQGNRVVPYYDRSQINSDSSLLSGQELLWVDDPVA